MHGVRFKKQPFIVLGIFALAGLFHLNYKDKILPNNQNEKYNWLMATTWNDNLPLLQTNLEKMVKEIEVATDGQLKIQLVSQFKDAAGQEISVAAAKPVTLLQAVSKNEIQMLHSAAYYWKDEIPGSFYFSSVPFGLQHGEVKLWLEKEGIALWQALYAHHGIHVMPFACGHTGNQMAGWFKKEINSPADLRFLRMRIAGLGGEIMKECFEITPISMPPAEIFKEMQSGSLDAAEWIGPYDDFRLGLHTLNAYYYEPGWQEPNTVFELSIHKAAFESLPNGLQVKVKSVIDKYDSKIYQDYIYRKILDQKLNVKFRYFDKNIIKKLYQCTQTTLQTYNQADTTGFSQKIYDSYMLFSNKTIW
jgi:TRAP-type mannitol/chloroaromatic compound transport system substrate-binding protein